MDAPLLAPDVLASLPPAVVELLRGLQARIAQLEAENAELRVRLQQNSSNSSRPPSSDPPHVKPAPARPATGRRRGGQPGHPRHERTLLPPTQVVDHRPSVCDHCGGMLLGTDPRPEVRQVVELPRPAPQVVHHRLHGLKCLACGTATRAAVPRDAAGEYGPQLQAALALFSGAYRLSKRSIVAVCRDYFGVPISVGQVCALEQETAAALQPAVEAARDHVRTQPVNVDETSWPEASRKAWLWVAVTRWVSVFAIHRSRSRAAFADLMGPAVAVVVTSDRFSAYSHLPPERRQVCWAHLRRDFQAMIDRGGGGRPIGEALLAQADALLKAWREVREGTRSRAAFQSEVLPARREDLEATLVRGQACGCAKTAGVCAELHHLRASLWTFAAYDGVEPTNNAAERAVRHAVCWRKTSYGTASAAGSRFVERILTVVASCRQQGRVAVEFVRKSLEAVRHATTPPSLIPTPAS